MPLNFLLTSGNLIKGTSYQDTKESARITITPKDTETILFFKLDDSNDKNNPSEFRKRYNLTGKKICDLLIFYRNTDSKNNKIRFIFTETKGTHPDEGDIQLLTTFNQFIASSDWKNFIKNDNILHLQIQILLLCVFRKNLKLPNRTNMLLKRDLEKTAQASYLNTQVQFIDEKSFSEILRR